MSGKIHQRKKYSTFNLMACIVLAIAVGGAIYFWFFFDENKINSQRAKQTQDQKLLDQDDDPYQKIHREKIVDFDRLNKDENLRAIIQERKDQFGLDDGIDAIVRADESLKVGDSIIPMKEILEKVRISQGGVIEESLSDKALEEDVDVFGVYVVKPNDNLWNIHFRFLRNYFERKNILLTPMADKPDEKGLSSGVGKILKFSEKIVYIYNIRDRKLYVDLNLLYPRNEIVIFHMEEVFSLLDQIDLQNVDSIQFDGQNLWIPAKS
ncbi:MAG: hypothetical protein R6U27_12895 [Desulfobacterales bacterium]